MDNDLDFPAPRLRLRSSNYNVITAGNEFQASRCSSPVKPSTKKSPKKKKSKKKNKLGELNKSNDSANKKESGKKHNVKEQGAGEGRKIIKAKRRIPKSSPPENLAKKERKKKSKFTKCDPMAIESRENEEFVSARSEFSTSAKDPVLKSPEIITRTRSQRNSSGITDLCRELEVTTHTSWVKTEPIMPRPQCSPKKISSRRNTYELENTVNDVEVLKAKSPDNNTKSKRNTFEVDPNDSYLLSAKKRKKSARLSSKRNTYELEMPQMDENKRKSAAYKNDITFNMEQSRCEALNDLMPPWQDSALAMNFTDDTKISITSSPNISAAQLLRRANLMSPPSASNSKINLRILRSAVKKKTPITSARKVPNYEAIHKRAIDKMESLEDHIQRKKERAKLLLSGAKVPIGRTPSISENSTRKQLNYPKLPSTIKGADVPKPITSKLISFKADTKSGNTPNYNFKTLRVETPKTIHKSPRSKSKSPRFKLKMPCSSTVLPFANSESSNTISPRSKSKLLNSKLNSPNSNSKSSQSNSKVPRFVCKSSRCKPKTPQSQPPNQKSCSSKLLRSKQKSPNPKSSISKHESNQESSQSNPQLSGSPRSKPKMVITSTPVKRISPSKNAISPVKNVPKPQTSNPSFNRYGFRLDSKSSKDKRNEEIKSVASKTRVAKSKVEDRRNLIKGVRSNRRFDLLMNMRQKNQ